MAELKHTIVAVGETGETITPVQDDFFRLAFDDQHEVFLALGTDKLDPFQRGLHVERLNNAWVIRVYEPTSEEPIQTIYLDANNHLEEGDA